MPSICIVGLETYPVLNPAYGDRKIGGESVQLTLLARAFRDLGYDVTIMERDYGQPEEEVIDGLRVVRAFKAGKGLPGLRFLMRLRGNHRTLKRLDADIYYQSSASILTGVAAWVCARKKRKFVFRVAHDTDCQPGKQILRRPWPDRKVYEYGLKRADLIFAQSERQQRDLRELYGLESELVNMCLELPTGEELGLERDIDVLWVNNMRPFKRPEWMLDLAEMIPELKVTMVGGPVVDGQEYFDELKARAGGIPNLDFVGAVPYSQVNPYYARAKVFVNTSESEGFPNSFLQAWVRRTPVVSFFDPDGVIAAKGLGGAVKALPDMAARIRELVRDRDAGQGDQELPERVRRFALDNFSPDAVGRTYDALFKRLLA